MKKITLFAVAAMMLAGFASCEEDVNKKEQESTSVGLYVLNAGNAYSKIPGAVTAWDYKSGAVTAELEDAFMNANKIEPGDLTGGILYGSKMYLSATESNVIWVVNPTTMKVIKQIQPEGDAKSPRYFAKKDGKLYVSMFTGYVSVLDTLTLSIEKSVKVGPNPERLAVVGDKVYVPNSDGWGTFSNSSISVVDIKTFAESKITNEALVNPVQVESDGKNVFVLCMGNYSTIPGSIQKLESYGVKEVCNATKMAMRGDKIYALNAPYGKPVSSYTYQIYSANSLEKVGDMIKQEAGTESEVAYPTELFVDSATGDIVVLSYRMNGEWPGYSLPGYAYLYDHAGTFKKRIATNVDPKFVVFKHE